MIICAQFFGRGALGRGSEAGISGLAVVGAAMAAMVLQLEPKVVNRDVSPPDTVGYYNFPLPESLPLPHRILGLDVGSKTIGMAVSDPLGITAQGLPTYRRKNKRLDMEALSAIIQRYDVRQIVVGYPLRMSGAQGTQSEKMARFADDLKKHFELPVHLWDERLTSAEANRVLRESEMSIKRRGEVVDQLAAVLILQSWMEASRQSSVVSLPPRPPSE